jgi:hypothetical protein
MDFKQQNMPFGTSDCESSFSFLPSKSLGQVLAAVGFVPEFFFFWRLRDSIFEGRKLNEDS